ncbi:D-alanine--poly(phosphoribitol) ligase subunit 2 [Nonomuraea coxensis DSM 45129]|uniref:D-alanine--poly(Phosphoribitol) ligase subunit 2 n=1 Tax=Nonomuraea coxensis DSM 45129 TaxID=1122611 RepID=A0ABX8UC07_9ACTN|nr:phosphopantetheine-binding protein [Nonomuraea coxensis]QYC45217.1 D-alanine--poly(phosphoribitol) ligase subunit 2 [Nonomuraea coxensis DSM 45129]
MTADELSRRLVAFVQESLVPDDVELQVDETTPLLLSGLLDSLRTARLLNFIRRELGVPVPAAKLDPDNFKDVATIVALITELEAASTR